MTTQRGSDEGPQANRQHYKPEPPKGVPAQPSDIAQEYTVKLGEDVLPLPERPAPAARRPSGITDAPTSLLSMPSQPESPPTKSATPSDAARPPQPPGSPPVQKGASSAPRSRWGVPVEPEVRQKRVEEATPGQHAAAARPEATPIREMSPLRPDLPPAKQEIKAISADQPSMKEEEPARFPKKRMW